MKMKITMLKHSNKMELSDGRILPVGRIEKPNVTYVHSGEERFNLAEVVKCWQDGVLLYQRMNFEKETSFCDSCETIDDVCFRPDHYEKGYYTAYGEWECGRCHTQDGLGVLRQCSACGGEFNSHEGEAICEVCQERMGI